MLVDTERRDLRIERLTRNPEPCRGAMASGDPPSRRGQGGLDHLSFGLRLDALLLCQRGADRNAWLACSVGVAGEPRFVNGERVAVAQDHGPLDDVLELPNVPWPVVRLEERQRGPADLPDALAGFRGKPLDQIFDQERDVFGTLAERRDVDRKDVEPVKQILPECSCGNRFRQVAVGRRQEADVHVNRVAVAHALDLVILKDAEQGDLGFRRQIADFVEENRATVGGFESPQTSLQRARERALLVAKELRRDERRRDGCAVYPNEGASGSMRFPMNGSRDQFLAATGVARDEDG